MDTDRIRERISRKMFEGMLGIAMAILSIIFFWFQGPPDANAPEGHNIAAMVFILIVVVAPLAYGVVKLDKALQLRKRLRDYESQYK